MKYDIYPYFKDIRNNVRRGMMITTAYKDEYKDDTGSTA